tara:strand:+ start:68 stop:502 length:435 start_codon:yes stop_codon:yes gene_type:complete
MLFLGLGAVGITLTAIIGGWVLYQEVFAGEKVDTTESETPTVAYYSEAEWLEEPQATVKYLVEDDKGIDTQLTLNAVMDWVKADDPNIWTGDWEVKVWSWNDAGVVSINGDASTLIEDKYDDVEVPYFTGEGFIEHTTIDLDFT